LPGKRRKRRSPPASNGRPALRWPELALGVLVVFTTACYWFITEYFFAQDDFILLEKAAFAPFSAIAEHLSGDPGQCRPLTKGVYFAVMYRVFGMNPFAYHVVSLLLHAFNTVMTWRVLKRLGVGEAGALAGTALFALSSGFFHVLAWISCIQQLAGLALGLVCLESGLRSLGASTLRYRWICVGAYVGAIASMEQLALLPVVMVLFAVLEPGKGRVRLRNALVEYQVLLAVMVVYLLFMGVWKGPPQSGPYDFDVGTNVAVNLLTYLGWSFEYLMRLSGRISVTSYAFEWSHVFAVGLVVYHLVRRRFGAVAMGLGYFVALILPALFLTAHQFYLHTYISSLGTIYLVALLVDDGASLLGRARFAWRAIPYAAIVAFAVLAWRTTRINETSFLAGDQAFRKSFVMRRAIVAENLYKSISLRRSLAADGVYLVYSWSRAAPPSRGDRPQDEQEDAYKRVYMVYLNNFTAAIGRGSAVRLLYGVADLPVELFPLESAPQGETPGIDVFYFDDRGQCRTPEEFGRG
jgi:hypothetical protein